MYRMYEYRGNYREIPIYWVIVYSEIIQTKIKDRNLNK